MAFHQPRTAVRHGWLEHLVHGRNVLVRPPRPCLDLKSDILTASPARLTLDRHIPVINKGARIDAYFVHIFSTVDFFVLCNSQQSEVMDLTATED